VSSNQGKNGKSRVEAAYDAALEEAVRLDADPRWQKVWEDDPSSKRGHDIVLGAVRLRDGIGTKHLRWIGRAEIEITYRGPRREPDAAPRPMYKVVIKVGRLRHKLSVGAPANWYEEHGLPISPEAIDATAGGAVRFASTPDEDTDPDVAATIEGATQEALKVNGEYEVRRSA
jgi:hypothetical protein